MPEIQISFKIPSSVPNGGFRISYRPKNSTQSYYSVNCTTSPVTIQSNILANVDYEGYLQGICNGSTGKAKLFSTSKYTNATGVIKVKDCSSPFTGSIISVTFGGKQLLPLNTPLPLSKLMSGDFISNATGTGDLIITHSFTKCHFKVIDSQNVIYDKSDSTGTVTFSGIKILPSGTFSIKTTCLLPSL